MRVDLPAVIMRGRARAAGTVVAVVVALAASVRPSIAQAGAADRFVAWLATHPEVQRVSVSSNASLLEPFVSRFPTGPKRKIPPSALVRIIDGSGSLLCLARPPAHICARVPNTARIWIDGHRSRDDARHREDVILLGPMPDRRVAVYSLRVPDAIARSGESLRMNPKWSDPPHQGPWWAFEYEPPILGSSRAALRKGTRLPPATDVPDWLDDTVGFAVFPTGDPKVLRMETAPDVGLCVRSGVGWVCRPVPPISLDQIHPGLPPTNSALPAQVPVIYAGQAAFQGDTIAVAIERSWIRSKKPHTPSLEWTGTFVDIVELHPGAAAFSRRATLELSSGRLTDTAEVARSGFPAVTALSAQGGAWCIDVVASGIIPPKMRTVPLGRYCTDADGRLVQRSGGP